LRTELELERITPTGELEPMEPEDLELELVEEREVGDVRIPTGAVRARRCDVARFIDVLRGLDDLTPVRRRLGLEDLLELDDLPGLDDLLELDDRGVRGDNCIRPPPGVIFLADLGDFDASTSTRVGTPHLKFSLEWNKSL